jgi:hypothetical protein
MGSASWALVLGALSVVGAATGVAGMRRPDLPPVWALIAFNALGVAVLARMFSPALVAPAIAGLVATSLATHPRVDRRTTLVLAASLIAAIAIPMLGEWLDIVSPTMEVTSNGLLIEAIARTGAWFLYATVPVYAASLIIGGIGLTRGPLLQDRTTRRQLYLQAWQLRQLVTDSSDRAAA